MASHSSIPAWEIPWTEEPGGLQFTGSQSQTRLKRLSTHSLKTCETSQLSSFTGREELTYTEPLLCAWPFIYSVLFYSHNNPMTCMLLTLFYR